MKRVLSVFVFLFWCVSAIAQSAGFLHFSVEEGLPQSQVLAISQDLKGNLWVGTMSGMSRFDGRNFKTFNIKNGLSENWITASSADLKGNVWVGHWGGGLSVISSDGRNARKVVVPGFENSKPVTSIVQTSDSILWVGTDGGGLIRINLNSNKADNVLAGMIPASIKSVTSANGNLYLATAETVMSVVDFSSAKPSVSVLYSGKSVTDVIVNNDRIYFTDNGHLLMIAEGNAPTLLPGPSSIESMIFDNQSRLWVATYGHGVYVFDKISAGDFTSRNFTEREGLNFNFTNVVFQDRDNNIWIGSDLGINLLAGERFSLFDKGSGIENSLVWSVLSDRAGNIYAGTGDGIYIKSPGSSVFNKVFIPALQGRTIISLFEDQTGRIWAGTMQAGLFVIRNNKLEKHYGPDKGFPFEKINRVAEQHDGSMWIATDKGAGRISPSGEVTWFTTDNGLLNDYVTTVYIDSKDHVWFGFTGNGMQSYASGRFTVPFRDSVISTATVLSIVEDRLGNIWAGAYGDGLFVFDGQRIKNIRINDGTNSDSPLSLAIDEKNRIWFGTNRGVDSFDPVKQQFQHFGRKRGFPGVETNINAITRDRNGSIWFGCLLGALKLDPSDDLVPGKAPFPTIDNIQVFFQDKETGMADQFTFEQNHLSFGFSSVYLKDPEKVRYQFMLDGFDKDWSPVTDKPFATYPNLPPGKYKFLVKSGFLEGVWSTPTEYSFEISPPFWRTWWFNAMLIGGVTTVLMLLIELKTRKVKKSKKELEILVRERTIELGQKNMELARKNKELSDLVKSSKKQVQ